MRPNVLPVKPCAVITFDKLENLISIGFTGLLGGVTFIFNLIICQSPNFVAGKIIPSNVEVNDSALPSLFKMNEILLATSIAK